MGNKNAVRKWLVLLLLLGMAWPAMAARVLSIAQMEQLLGKLEGKPDGKVSAELDDVQLTERVSLTRLTQWKAEFAGPRAREQLMKLADLSAFLNPPAMDVIPDPPPDAETEERMMGMAVQYIKTTISRLPDFYATRETTHFEDMTYSVNPMGTGPEPGEISYSMPARGATTTNGLKSLHIAGQYSTTVTYRDGHEVHGIDAATSKAEDQPALGLTTSGEFGPILGLVVGDVMQSQVTWLRWEQGENEPAGVFRYTVPQDRSSYAVRIPAGTKFAELYPGYHGEIVIDPATGEILRMSLVTDMAPPFDRMQTAMMVEYAPVTIGDQSYICPVRSVAFSKMPVQSATAAAEDSALPVQAGVYDVNDVAFTNYHLFRAEAHILGAMSGTAGATPSATVGTAGPGVAQPAVHPQ